MTANVGTPVFMAPELMVNSRSVRYTPKIDVYSFGILAWECLYRKQPYDDDIVRGSCNKSPKKMNQWVLRASISEGLRPFMYDGEDDGDEPARDRIYTTDPFDGGGAKQVAAQKLPLNTQMVSLSVLHDINQQASQQQQIEEGMNASQTQRMSLQVLSQVNKDAKDSQRQSGYGNALRTGNFGPPIVNRLRTPVALQLRNLVQRCWDQDPTKRPSFANIDLELKQINDSNFPLSDEY
jgi:serine/threonine protein kinase